MIAIVNVTPPDEYDPAGVSKYEVRINRDVVARFEHSRPQGLAACLRAAAQAVDGVKKSPPLRRGIISCPCCGATLWVEGGGR